MSASGSQTTNLSASDKRALLAQRLRAKAAREKTVAPATIGQKALLYLDRANPESRAYTGIVVTKIHGVLDVDALHQALQKIVDRHAILRTTFERQDGEFVQVIHGARDVDFRAFQRHGSALEDLELESTQEASRPFILERDSSLRVRLYTVANAEHILVLIVHHIAFDYWSYDVFARELAAFYQSARTGVPAQIKPLAAQYADHARTQESMLSGTFGEQLWEYWSAEIAGDPEPIQLPLDHHPPQDTKEDGATHSLTLPSPVVAQLRTLAQQRNTTLYVVVLAALQVLLHRYSGQEDIIVGSPMACRYSSETEQLIGYFANVLPLRGDLSADPRFTDFIDQMHRKMIGALEHQAFPFARLIEKMCSQRNDRQHSLVNVALAWEKSHVKDGASGTEFELEFVYGRQFGAPYDLTVFAFDRQNQLSLTLLYNRDLFESSTIVRIGAHFETLLQSIAVQPEQRVSILSLLTPNDLRLVVECWNDTVTEYPRQATIHRLFEREAERRPDAVAAQFGEASLTYAELNRRSNQLAYFLLKKGVRRGDLIALCVERSLEMLVGILGILKAGAAYVPLDPAYPSDRLSFMLSDTNAQVLLTQERLLRSLPAFEGSICCLDSEQRALANTGFENPSIEVFAEDLAYVMYTSGSTGTPKGVCVPHRAIVRLVKNTNYADFSEDEVFLQFAPISFDAATLEIWGPLLNGGRVAIYPLQPLALDDLGHCIRRYGVTTLWLTSGLFQLMVDNRLDDLRGVRQLLAGGDVLSVPHVEKVRRELPECRLINGYGPTENTTFTCCYTVPKTGEIVGSVPIGRPISNTVVYVVDRRMQPVPVGIPGELYVGGDGLATGYLNRPELTAERFVANPFTNDGSRLYRTGDMVRYRADGNLEFLGRVDDQVKIRGFRVEPGEIETALNRHAGVRNSAVVVHRGTDGSKSLVAYVVPASSQDSLSEIRAYVESTLPDHMVPAFFIKMDSLPLSPNGKVDRRALPPPEVTAEKPAVEFLQPQSDVEQTIASIWKRALNVTQVGRFDNFFDLGGHSLLLAKVHEEMQQATGSSFAIVDMFRYPTVSAIAAHISGAGADASSVEEARDRARQQRVAMARRSARQSNRRPIHERP